MTATVRYVAPLLWQGTPQQTSVRAANPVVWSSNYPLASIRQAVPVVWSQQAVQAYVRGVAAVQWIITPIPATLRRVNALQWSQDLTTLTSRKAVALQWTQDPLVTTVRQVNAVTWGVLPTSGQLRQASAYTLQVSATSGQLRQAVAYTLQKQVKPQTTGGLTGLWPLIQADASITVNSTNLNVAAPVADTSVPNTNTYVTVSPKGALLNQYSGTYKLHYNRQDINVAFNGANNTWKLSVPSNTTILALLSSINSAYAMALDPTDVVDGPVLAGATKLQLVIASTSYVYLPGTSVWLSNATALSSAIVNPNLPGFANASGQGPSASTIALLHFDGVNGSTTFTDQAGLAWTANGGATISTAQAKFGTSSFANNGTANQSISTPDTTSLHLTGDFTVEFFVRPTNTTTSQILTTKGPGGRLILSGGSIFAYDDTSGNAINGGSVTANAWNHVALVKKSGTTTLYLNGVVIGSNTTFGTFGNNTGNLFIGSYYDGTYPMFAAIDEYRISNIARYTAAFTPPIAPFTAD